MNYVLRKKFTFEAAHRLIKNYEGKCTNNHGHSFEVILELEGSTLDDKDMLIDFKETKALKTWIDDALDHASIMWKEDAMIPDLEKHGQKVYITEKNPTSEHIAEIILEKAVELFQNQRVTVRSIQINETCTSGIILYAK